MEISQTFIGIEDFDMLFAIELGNGLKRAPSSEQHHTGMAPESEQTQPTFCGPQCA